MEYLRTRPTVYSKKAIVSSSSIQASIIGSDILKRGGNVFDAAIGVSAALAVTQNNLSGLGGDFFALLRISGKGIYEINGSGSASHNVDISFFKKRGLKKIPTFGTLSAITVPGIVHAWGVIHKNYCTMDLEDILSPAINLAANGFPVTTNYRRSIEIASRYLSSYNWSNIFMPDGKIPDVGSIFKIPDLASILKMIAKDGTDTFYKGHIADIILKSFRKNLILIDDEDLEKHYSSTNSPRSINYHGYEVFETSPNSQGYTLLLWLNILKIIEEGKNSRNEIPDLEDIVKSGLIAYSQRFKISDPNFVRSPEEMLTKDYAEKLLDLYPTFINSWDPKEERGDTTYFSISDNDGNSVSAIQSNYLGFGSGISPEGAGFILQNRGTYFSLDEKHNNALMPGKRTFHTLMASIIERDGALSYSLGTMGGDIQPQIHFQLINNLINRGDDPQLAIDRPRWSIPHTIYESPSEIKAEPGSINLPSGRKMLGLNITMESLHSTSFGEAQIVGINRSGLVYGGADPRGDGFSIPLL